MSELSRLRADCEDVCRHAFEHRTEIGGAVNWADFTCTVAGRYQTDNGDNGLYVVIEEADPSQRELHYFISDGLAIKGWKDIEIRFEW